MTSSKERAVKFLLNMPGYRPDTHGELEIDSGTLAAVINAAAREALDEALRELERLRRVERAARWLIETEPFRESHCGGAPDCAIDALRTALEDA